MARSNLLQNMWSTILSSVTNTMVLGPTYTDAAGNQGVSASTAYLVDTKGPTVGSFTISQSSFKVGEVGTVTLVFSEPVSGFDSTQDVSVQNGTLSKMTSADENVTWTGIFTPSLNVESTSSVLSLSQSYTDTHGNPGVIGSLSKISIDTMKPLVNAFTISKSRFTSGETGIVSITFSESVIGFDSDQDITTESGTLSKMTSKDGNITWTGVFTPSSDLESVSQLVLLQSYTDAKGNQGIIARSSELSVDTRLPSVVSFATSKASLKTGDTCTVELVFSEPIPGFNSTLSISIQNGTLPMMTSVDNITWVGTFTPSAEIRYELNNLSINSFTDLFGNMGTSTKTVKLDIDTLAETTGNKHRISNATLNFNKIQVALENATDGELPEQDAFVLSFGQNNEEAQLLSQKESREYLSYLIFNYLGNQNTANRTYLVEPDIFYLPESIKKDKKHIRLVNGQDIDIEFDINEIADDTAVYFNMEKTPSIVILGGDGVKLEIIKNNSTDFTLITKSKTNDEISRTKQSKDDTVEFGTTLLVLGSVTIGKKVTPPEIVSITTDISENEIQPNTSLVESVNHLYVQDPTRKRGRYISAASRRCQRLCRKKRSTPGKCKCG